MHISTKAFNAAILIIGMAGCAGRAPQPVAIVQPTDPLMDCAAISIEAQANNAKLQALGAEEGNKVGQNVAAGVVGLFIRPVWFAMDFRVRPTKRKLRSTAGINTSPPWRRSDIAVLPRSQPRPYLRNHIEVHEMLRNSHSPPAWPRRRTEIACG